MSTRIPGANSRGDGRKPSNSRGKGSPRVQREAMPLSSARSASVKSPSARSQDPRTKSAQSSGPRASGASSASTWRTVHERVSGTLARPLVNYLVILSVTLLLTAFGLTMVLSSSMVDSRANGGSVFTEFFRQATFVAIGLVGMWVAIRMPPQKIRKYAPWLLFAALFLLAAVLVPGLGSGDELGSRSWLRLGAFGVQPSEIAKLALAVWGSSVVAERLPKSNGLFDVLGRFLLYGALILGMVLFQKDLGMMMSVGIVLLSLVFLAGARGKIFLGAVGLVAAVGLLAILTASYRSARITTWLDTMFLDFSDSTTQGAAFQSYQGILSISDGGFFGLGLGQSRAKWFYLPEATNDFIFAVVGEELGFLGAMAVVTLFALLGWFGIKTALAHVDPFMRLLAASLTMGVMVQAFLNMGYVVGFMPVTGIQLPLISAGGTSAVITLFSLGLLANCARHEPNTVSAMQHEGRPWIDRILFLPEPQPVVAGSERREERRSTTQQYGEPVTQRRGGAGRAGQDARRERDRLAESRRRVGAEDYQRDYDGRRRSSLPPVQEPRSRRVPRDPQAKSPVQRRTNRPDSRRR